MHTATYSPDDNKLRLYPAYRLAADEYARVKEAGFKWAPRQELFVAPMWTPEREDVLMEFCGEIGDEDKSLVERAEERADRFEDYSSNRQQDADAARRAVSAIADHIPLGQPILIGHHSERRARKDAERIENGMRKAVKLWETSKYWQQRAAGALQHAKYKELPGVRARRIKGLEADKRKAERNKAEAEKFLSLWQAEGLTFERASAIANRSFISRCFTLAEYPRPEGASTYEGSMSIWSALNDGIINEHQARDICVPILTRQIEINSRWIAHYENRLVYERAMLEEQGASDLLKPKAREKQLPLCNYQAPEGIMVENIYHKGQFSLYPQVEMTQAEYAKIYRDYKGTRVIERSHRIRTAYQRGKLVCVFLTDAKVHAKPEAGPEPEPTPPKIAPIPRPAKEESETDKQFKALREAVREGVQVVSAPQLFPTPAALASRMVQLAQPQIGQRVLEPSAGTGRLLEALPGVLPPIFSAARQTCLDVVAVEKNLGLVNALKAGGLAQTVLQADFLECSIEELGQFDVVLMNPPFENAADIKHIKHAYSMLKPGGCLVAICANGPRQAAELRGLAESTGGIWEALPAGTFAGEGTGVNTALLVLHAPA